MKKVILCQSNKNLSLLDARGVITNFYKGRPFLVVDQDGSFTVVTAFWEKVLSYPMDEKTLSQDFDKILTVNEDLTASSGRTWDYDIRRFQEATCRIS